MSVAMLVLGSASIGLAIFLILEFSQPYTELDPRLAGAARTGDPSARPAERRRDPALPQVS